MVDLSADVLHARSELGNATRSGDSQRIADARGALEAAKLARSIHLAFHELTPDQRAHCASLLLPDGVNAPPSAKGRRSSETQ